MLCGTISVIKVVLLFSKSVRTHMYDVRVQLSGLARTSTIKGRWRSHVCVEMWVAEFSLCAMASSFELVVCCG